MPETRFRPTIRRLLDEMLGDAPQDLFSVNVSLIAERAGVSRQVVYNWLNADVDDQSAWFARYDGETARKFKEFFSDLMGRDVEIIESIECEFPSYQETAALLSEAA